MYIYLCNHVDLCFQTVNHLSPFPFVIQDQNHHHHHIIMKGRRFCRFVIIMMCIMRVISRPLVPNDGAPILVPTKQEGTKTQIMSPQSSMAFKAVWDSRFSTKDEDERYGRGIENRIGSRPPSCDHKCYGCSPCEPTQVPTTSHVGIQYTNYEPEGWKCKCGPTFYSP